MNAFDLGRLKDRLKGAKTLYDLIHYRPVRKDMKKQLLNLRNYENRKI